jgi:putative transposase
MTGSTSRWLGAPPAPPGVGGRILKVSRSGYYDWKGRPASPRQVGNDLISKHLEGISVVSRGTYGYRRAHAELVLGLGLPVNRKRVQRLMRAAGLQGLPRHRRGPGTTIRSGEDTAADLVQRQFTAGAASELWVTDITEHPPWKGNCMSRLSSMCIHDVSSAGAWPITCAPSSSSTPSGWP